MKYLKNLFGTTRKQNSTTQFYHNDQYRFSKTMPGESAALASVRLGCMSL